MKVEMSKKLFVACALLGSLAAEAMIFAISWYRKRRDRRKLGKDILQILFFPDQRIRCSAHFNERRGCRKLNCPYTHEISSLSELTRYLNGARVSVDLCVFTITCHELADHIIELHRSGLKVRVITDIEQIDATGSQIGKFRQEGINVRHNHDSYFMHHKFAIIDSKLLLSGSFNWTRQAITGNHENVLATNNKDICSPYIEEFKRLWKLFDPAANR